MVAELAHKEGGEEEASEVAKFLQTKNMCISS